MKENQVQLIKEAYNLLIRLAAKNRNKDNHERLERLEEEARDRLLRRLDELSESGK